MDFWPNALTPGKDDFFVITKIGYIIIYQIGGFVKCFFIFRDFFRQGLTFDVTISA